MAAFLIGAGEGHYYGFGGWFSNNKTTDFHTHRSPLFDKKLGAPTGPGLYDAAGKTWGRTIRRESRIIFSVAKYVH